MQFNLCCGGITTPKGVSWAQKLSKYAKINIFISSSLYMLRDSIEMSDLSNTSILF